MARTAEIILDGKMFVVRAFNIDQLERAMTSQKGFDVLRIALERSEPPIERADVEQLEPTLDEIRPALEAVMRLSGLEVQPGPPA